MSQPFSDKVTISADYDDHGICHQIYVYLNYDGLTAQDVAVAVRAVLGGRAASLRVVDANNPEFNGWFRE